MTIVFVFVMIRSRRMEKIRKRDEDLARSQNEANSRSLMKKKCLDNDPFKGHMIVNSLNDNDNNSSIHGYSSTAASVSSHNFSHKNLNRAQNLSLSKSMTKLTNCDYESNLKLACKQQHQPNSDYGKVVSMHPSSSPSSSCKKQGIEQKSHEVVRFPPHTLHRINCPRKGLNQQVHHNHMHHVQQQFQYHINSHQYPGSITRLNKAFIV
jgi:hypothetical protein